MEAQALGKLARPRRGVNGTTGQALGLALALALALGLGLVRKVRSKKSTNLSRFCIPETMQGTAP